MPTPRRLLALSLALSALLPTLATARSGTHAPSLATFDTRASSVSLTFSHATHARGSLDHVAYTTAFSSTSGRLSSQFVAAYVRRTDEGRPVGHGASVSAMTLYVVPVGRRDDHGLSTVAVGVYGGPSPTFIGGSIFGQVSIPLVLGVGLPITPAPWITLTPFGELVPSVDFDARVRDDFELNDDNADKPFEELVEEAVDWVFDFHMGWRAGVMLGMHLGEHIDLNIVGDIRNDGAFDRTQWSLGGTFVWHWDDLVQGVKPRQKRRRCPPCMEVGRFPPRVAPPRAPKPPARPPSPTDLPEPNTPTSKPAP